VLGPSSFANRLHELEAHIPVHGWLCSERYINDTGKGGHIDLRSATETRLQACVGVIALREARTLRDAEGRSLPIQHDELCFSESWRVV
jgi:hypothetical protein